MQVPIIVKDLSTLTWKGLRPEDGIEDYEIRGEEYFLDGPVSPRVAVVDFDPKTGQCAAVRLTKGKTRYQHGPAPSLGQSISPRFLSVSVFGTVHKVISLFEEADTLGRKLRWAFDAPQLLIVPRAGDMANAFYERESHSLQFFEFEDPHKKRRFFTAGSQDIVAHETGHAVLDAIAPDLYDAMTPQSLAMHEAIADLVSLHCAIRCRALSDKVLDDVGGELEGAGSTAFSVLAAELGEARDPLADYLRDLAEQVGLPGSARGVKEVATNSPHDLSVVLSGALYRVLLHHYGTARKDIAKKGIPPSLAYKKFAPGPAGVWQCALFIAAERFKRFVFRALDYLPPGDATWIDLSHAILACDKAHHPDADDLRDALVHELARRGVGTKAELQPAPVQHDADLLKGIELRTLVESDWAAHEWVRRRREVLGIPPDVPFDVRRRLDVTKHIYHRAGRHEQSRELVLKVAWEAFEDNPKELLLARRRSVTRGTTLAIQWAEHAGDHRVLAHITSSTKPRDRAERDALLLRLEDDGLLRRAEGSASRQLDIGRTLYAEVTDDVMTMKGGARLLHIVPETNDD